MKSYTTMRNLYGTLTLDNSSTNLTLGDQFINDSYRRVVAERDWDFVQKTATATTVASQQFYNLPYDYEKLITTSITVGTQVYTPKEAPTRAFWDQLNSVSSFTSNFPEWFFIFNGQIGYYPTPSTSAFTITYVYDRLVIDLSMADYTTGTVTVTNGSTTVTGTGTTWTAPMVGRYIKITPTDTAGASGDGFWYQIATVASTTSLTLVKAYQGVTVSAGTAYAIGQMSVLPDAYQDLPVYDAVRLYYSSIKPEQERYNMYSQIWDRLHTGLIADHSDKTTDPTINDEDMYPINPNLYVNA